MCELIVLGLVVLLLVLIICSHRLGYISGHCDAGGPTTPTAGKEGAGNPQASSTGQAHAAANSAVGQSTGSGTLSAGTPTIGVAAAVAAMPAAVTVSATPSALPASVVAPAATDAAAPMAVPIAGLGSADVNAPVPNLAQAAAIVAAQKGSPESKPKPAFDATCCKYKFSPDYWYLTGTPDSADYANWYQLK